MLSISTLPLKWHHRFLDNDTTGHYNTSILPQQTYQAGFSYLNICPGKAEKRLRWHHGTPVGTAWLCLCGAVPSPLTPAKDTARQCPGRAGFWLASFGLPEKAPSLKHPIPTLVVSVLYGPGARGSCRNVWEASSRCWSAVPLERCALCFTWVRFTPPASWSGRKVLW